MLNLLRKIIAPDNPIRLLWHKSKAVAAAVRYGFPGRKLVCIGVTGSDGKTTTTHMIEHVLRTAGKKVAMLSTVEFRIHGRAMPNTSKKTTLSPFFTQQFLRQCVQQGVDYAVIECASHGLHQSRLWGIPFQIAVLTNITHEHLDYHKTMAEYAKAKRLLFEEVSRQAARQIPRRGACPEDSRRAPRNDKYGFVINTASQFFDDFMKLPCPNKLTYGFDKGELRALHPAYTKYGSKFTIQSEKEEALAALALPGDFNVENALAATGAALLCGVILKDIAAALPTFSGVPGRMERIQSSRGFEVIVDFALTPAALQRLYDTIRETAPARVIGIIGSCGDRDKEKRPLMGRIVAERTDLCIVTDEEPYSEDPKAIMEAVLAGAMQTPKKIGTDLFLIDDRHKAIEFAVAQARPGDTVVVTGMGSFDTRTMNSGPIPWDEREVVREILSRNQ